MLRLRRLRVNILKVGLEDQGSKSSLETELVKLFETTYRAWMIICFYRFFITINPLFSLLSKSFTSPIKDSSG
jgi:hypothetical protein